MQYTHRNITYHEDTTVQQFTEDDWYSGELKYDGLLGWYVEYADGEVMVKDWDKIRPNILEEPEELREMKRIQLTPYASARVSKKVSRGVVDALTKLAKLAYKNTGKLTGIDPGTMELRCKYVPLNEEGNKLLKFTEGEIYHFEKNEDPPGWVVTDDKGDQEVFFSPFRMFENTENQ